MKNICASKDTIKKVEPTGWEKILANHISDPDSVNIIKTREPV